MGLSNSIPNAVLQQGVCTSTTRPSNPYKGQTIYETDTGRLLVYYGATTGWKPPWGQPWGHVAYANPTASVTSTGAELDIPDMTVTFTATANRLYRITAQVTCYNTGSPIDWVARVRETAVVAFSYKSYHNTSSSATQVVEWIGTLTAGSHTLKVTLQRTGGSGSAMLDYGAGNSYNPVLMVSDIGPATSTAPTA